MSKPHNLLLLTLALDLRRVELEIENDNIKDENARLRKRLYDMMDEKSVEVFSAERAMDRITNVVVGGLKTDL